MLIHTKFPIALAILEHLILLEAIELFILFPDSYDVHMCDIDRWIK